MTIVLGIETSCDETSAAVVENGRTVLSNIIATQFNLHAKYGGVVPEIASRAHVECLDAIVREALECSGRSPGEIDLVAVTKGPGLIGCLLVGMTAAKTLAWSWRKPIIGVNHIHAHATSASIGAEGDLWPAVALVVSGGHTSLYHVEDYNMIGLLGCTVDDAAGEAFDKIASILQLGFPGGPIVDRLAKEGNERAVRFPRTMLKAGSLDFSFSGLKTSVLYQVHGRGKTSGGLEKLSPQDVADLCASFSAAVVDVLVEKTMMAVERCGVRTVVVGGGVAANSMLRRKLEDVCRATGLELHLTPMKYCTDNAAMIAALGYHLECRGFTDDLTLTSFANLGLA